MDYNKLQSAAAILAILVTAIVYVVESSSAYEKIEAQQHAHNILLLEKIDNLAKWQQSHEGSYAHEGIRTDINDLVSSVRSLSSVVSSNHESMIALRETVTKVIINKERYN